jgi:competence protein ComEA
MAVGLLVCVGALWVRGRQGGGPPPRVVEVDGEVPRPGLHAVPAPATVGAALRLAGVDPSGIPAGVLGAEVGEGVRITVEGGSVRLSELRDPLVVGLPVDVNRASAEALEALPGVGPSTAAAIVAEREAGGPYADVDALVRARGVGPATVEALRPFITAGN